MKQTLSPQRESLPQSPTEAVDSGATIGESAGTSPIAHSPPEPVPSGGTSFWITRCAWCRRGKVLEDWWPVEDWKHFESRFSVTDGICPDCVKVTFGDPAPIHEWDLCLAELQSVRRRVEACLQKARKSPESKEASRALNREIELLSKVGTWAMMTFEI